MIGHISDARRDPEVSAGTQGLQRSLNASLIFLVVALLLHMTRMKQVHKEGVNQLCGGEANHRNQPT